MRLVLQSAILVRRMHFILIIAKILVLLMVSSYETCRELSITSGFFVYLCLMQFFRPVKVDRLFFHFLLFNAEIVYRLKEKSWYLAFLDS